MLAAAVVVERPYPNCSQDHQVRQDQAQTLEERVLQLVEEQPEMVEEYKKVQQQEQEQVQL